jgi:hypothetical protein
MLKPDLAYWLPSGFWFFYGQGRLKLSGAKACDAATKNFGDNKGRVAGALNAKISELIRGETLRMERAEAGFVAEQGATGHGHAAREQNVYRGIQPDNGNSGIP